ncbi:MAG: ribonuclease P protein component [Microgenomates group bacterium]
MVAIFYLVEGKRVEKNFLLSYLMLARKNRIIGKSNFEKIKNEGVLYQGKAFGLAVLKREESNLPRFAFVISTKISKKAVERNRAKRRLGEAVRKNLDKTKNGFDVLFLAKKEILKSSAAEITDEITRLFKEADISR